MAADTVTPHLRVDRVGPRWHRAAQLGEVDGAVQQVPRLVFGVDVALQQRMVFDGVEHGEPVLAGLAGTADQLLGGSQAVAVIGVDAAVGAEAERQAVQQPAGAGEIGGGGALAAGLDAGQLAGGGQPPPRLVKTDGDCPRR